MNSFTKVTLLSLFIFTFICSQLDSYNYFSIDYHSPLNIELNYLHPITDINPDFSIFTQDMLAHGGGLNKCGCHFNRKTGECHCHRDRGCGCECQPNRCE